MLIRTSPVQILIPTGRVTNRSRANKARLQVSQHLWSLKSGLAATTHGAHVTTLRSFAIVGAVVRARIALPELHCEELINRRSVEKISFYPVCVIVASKAWSDEQLR